jgi:hypothetical protein
VPGYKFTGSADVPAALDFGAAQNTAVRPVSAGRVLASWPVCNVVIIDQGSGVWAEYVHLQVAVTTGQTVGRDSVLGYLLGAYDHSGTNCGDHSTGPHLHFAFISGSGTTGRYVPIAGQVLCGRTVDGSGNLVGLGSVGGASFSVPNCETPGQATITPTPKPIITPTPKPVVTPAPKAPAMVTPPAQQPAGSCDVPSVDAPAANSSFSSAEDVTLSWSTNCSQTYAELSGGPYGTLSFGGWNSATRVHIGRMWPGTYSWHVKGRTSSGQETSWSGSRTFAVQDASIPVVTDPPPPEITDPPTQVVTAPPAPPAPIVSAPPAPIVTAPPAPIVTDPPMRIVTPPAPIVTAPPAPIVTPSPKICPFMDGGGGVTFYSGANFTGQSWTWYVPAGNGDAYSDLPAGLFRNLGSFYVSNNAWHVVLYQGENGTGNLGHYDASWANVDSYWHVTQSVKIYINRTNC